MPPKRKRRVLISKTDSAEDDVAVAVADGESDDEGVVLDEIDNVSTRISGMRIEKNTKDGYSSKISRIVKFLKSVEKYRATVDEKDDLIVPLSKRAVIAIFNWLATETSLPREKIKPRSDAVDAIIAPTVVVSDDVDDVVTTDNVDNILERCQNVVTISVSTMQGYKFCILLNKH